VAGGKFYAATNRMKLTRINHYKNLTMKTTSLFFAISLFVCFSCINNNNAPLSQQEKEKITSEVNAVMNSMKEGMKNLDSEAFEATFLLDNEFKYVRINGKVSDANAFLKEERNEFNNANKADFTFVSTDIRVIRPDFAIVTLIYHGTFYFQNSTVSFPDCGVTLGLVKTADGWKVIHLHESVQRSKFVVTKLN